MLIDYDGALASGEKRQQLADPPEPVIHVLQRLTADPRNTVVLISGAQRPVMERWFGKLLAGMIAENGMWVREWGGEWHAAGSQDKSWKPSLLNVLLQYADRIPGSFVEEREHSIALQYRAADPDQSRNLAAELRDNLVHFTANIDVQILQGHKVLEIRDAGVNKGRAAHRWLSNQGNDFILALGDVWSDEELFRILPPEAFSLRVGAGIVRPEHGLRTQDDVREFLRLLADTGIAAQASFP